eukprot:268205-Prymnesium_polylepis.1
MGIWAAHPTCVQPRSQAVAPRPSSSRCRCVSSVMAARATADNWPTARCLWYRCAVWNQSWLCWHPVAIQVTCWRCRRTRPTASAP